MSSIQEQLDAINKIMGKVKKSNVVMPFGKYAGRYLSDIPRDYLKWINDRELDEELHKAIDLELFNRKGEI